MLLITAPGHERRSTTDGTPTTCGRTFCKFLDFVAVRFQTGYPKTFTIPIKIRKACTSLHRSFRSSLPLLAAMKSSLQVTGCRLPLRRSSKAVHSVQSLWPCLIRCVRSRYSSCMDITLALAKVVALTGKNAPPPFSKPADTARDERGNRDNY
jgi:hypothetical protein